MQSLTRPIYFIGPFQRDEAMSLFLFKKKR